MKNPRIYDAEYRVVSSVPLWQRTTARMVCAMLSLSPIIISMAGGLFGWWSVKAGVVTTIAGTLVMVGLYSWFDRSVLNTHRGTLMMLAVLVVIISITGCSEQPEHTDKRAALAQYAPEVEELKKNPDAFKRAVEQCGRANDARIKAGQLGSNKDYRCAAIVQAYYSQHATGVVFQGGTLDDNRN